MTAPNPTTTPEDDFGDAPPPMGFFSPSNHPNALALFVPKEFIASKEFTFGVKDCTVSAVWIIAGEGAGCEWLNAEVAGVKMASQLAGSIGRKVLGRITRETGSGNRAFVISKPSEDDKGMARAWLAAGNNLAKVARAQKVAETHAETVLAGPTGETGSTADAGDASKAATDLPAPPPVTRHDAPPF